MQLLEQMLSNAATILLWVVPIAAIFAVGVLFLALMRGLLRRAIRTRRDGDDAIPEIEATLAEESPPSETVVPAVVYWPGTPDDPRPQVSYASALVAGVTIEDAGMETVIRVTRHPSFQRGNEDPTMVVSTKLS